MSFNFLCIEASSRKISSLRCRASSRSFVNAFTLSGVIVAKNRIEKKKIKNRLIINQEDLRNEFKNNTNKYIQGRKLM